MSFLFSHLSPLLLVWLLIVIFTGSRDSEQSYREALICTIGLAVISIIFSFFVPYPYKLIRFPLQVVALYFLIDRICGCSIATTWRIIIWYVVLTLVFGVLFYFFRQSLAA
jgi:hypothetical protein